MCIEQFALIFKEFVLEFSLSVTQVRIIQFDKLNHRLTSVYVLLIHFNLEVSFRFYGYLFEIELLKRLKFPPKNEFISINQLMNLILHESTTIIGNTQTEHLFTS